MRWIGFLLRLAFVAACVVYAFWGMDLAELGRSFGRISAWGIFVAFAVSILQFFPLGGRFAYLSGGNVGYGKALGASMVCLGVNNLLPARLGELAKAAYLRHEAGLALGKALVMVFWERLFDLMTLLALSLMAAAIIGHGGAVVPLLALVAGLWCGVFLARYRPGFMKQLCGLVPFERIRLFLEDVLVHLKDGGSPRFFLMTGFWSVFIWFGYYLNFAIILNYVAKLNLSLGQVLVVFAVTAVGFALPSSPGALGVMEAAAVWSITQFGASREGALPGAILIHMTQYIPTVLITLFLMFRSGMSFKGLRTRKAFHS